MDAIVINIILSES